MATVNTWRAVALAVAFGNVKSMLDIFQAGTGSRVQRARRMYQFNNGLTAVTGVLTSLQVTRTTASSAGTPVASVPHDTG
ncbi:MAG TPA: hypothetical protein VGV13_13320, partial [Methylomirabilota bacterium]|nr:hypothetical protein [Methylomirabilota bacterium]